MSTRARIAGWLAVPAVGLFLTLTVLPPRAGLVHGLPRVVDLGVGPVLWPWLWCAPDPRLLVLLPLALAGALLWARPGWVGVIGLTVLGVETWQFLVPGLGKVADLGDLLHAWLALATGALVGLVLHALVRLVLAAFRKPTPVRALVPVLAVTVALVAAPAIWPSGQTEAVAEPHAGPQGPLLGQDFHPAAQPGAGARAWVQAGLVPGRGGAHEEMARVALWDLYLLTRGQGQERLPVAGPGAKWDYFWPRDGAFVAVALARTGHPEEAAEVLTRAAELDLDPLYGFDARYLPTGQPVVLDPRGAQVDGCGWLLWAIHETGQHADLPAPVAGLRDRCTDQVLRATGGGSRLAAPSPDYWEQATFDQLLGANAPLALGLRSAAADYAATGATQRAEVVGAAAGTFRAVLGESFGPDFYRGRDGGGIDAATAMLMPPFDTDPLPGVRAAWTAYQEGALRPAGGLAPGTSWKQDGVSWTPEVALVAYTAAADGQVEIARHWLDWLDAHRAPGGSLPEKVGPDGAAGGPAPLGWTSALVLLTLDELE